MGAKGQGGAATKVKVVPSTLIPAVTQVKLVQQTMESLRSRVKGRTEEALNSGLWAGERLQVQHTCADTIVTLVANMQELIVSIASNAQNVYEVYLDAEARSYVDTLVNDSVEKTAAKGSRSGLRKKK